MPQLALDQRGADREQDRVADAAEHRAGHEVARARSTSGVSTRNDDEEERDVEHARRDERDERRTPIRVSVPGHDDADHRAGRHAETEHGEERQAAREAGEESGPVHARDVPHLRHRVLRGLREAERAVQQDQQSDHEPEAVPRERVRGVLADLLAEHGELLQRGADDAVGDVARCR